MSIDWRLQVDQFRCDAAAGLVSVGETLPLVNGYEAGFDGSKVTVLSQHFDGDRGVWGRVEAEFAVEPPPPVVEYALPLDVYADAFLPADSEGGAD